MDRMTPPKRSLNLLGPWRRPPSFLIYPVNSKAEGVSCRSDNSPFNVGTAKFGITIRHRLQGASKSSIASRSEIIVDTDGISTIGAVERLGASYKCVGLNKNLGTKA